MVCSPSHSNHNVLHSRRSEGSREKRASKTHLAYNILEWI